MAQAMPHIKSIEEHGCNEACKTAASVVVITYGPRKNVLKRCLDGLRRQTFKEFEVVLVENGSSVFSQDTADGLLLKRVQLDRNYGSIIARNLGAVLASSDILIFLDDDGVPAEDFVKEHIKSYEAYPSVVGVRGAALPLSDKHNPFFSGNYELGEKVVPALLNLEGNCSVKKPDFIKIGGWDTAIKYGHEGLPLTYELTGGGKLIERVIYNPAAIIYHDNDKSLWKSIGLSFSCGRNYAKLEQAYPDLGVFLERYRSILNKADCKPQHKKTSTTRVANAVLYRLHDWCDVLGRRWQKALIKIGRGAESRTVNLDFFNDWFEHQRKTG